MKRILAFVMLTLFPILQPVQVAAAPKPGDILELKNWYLGLPTGSKGDPDNVYQPKLDSYTSKYFFVRDNSVIFRTPVNGVTTSGSQYPRTELREMNGAKKAAWNTGKGTHTMEIDQSINKIPVKKPEIVAGQLHGTSDDLFLLHLSGKRLRIKYDDGQKYKDIDTNYKLGTRFTVKFVIQNNQAKIYYNGVHKATVPAKSSTAYFKAGSYAQSNPSKGDKTGETEVQIYKLKVSHE